MNSLDKDSIIFSNKTLSDIFEDIYKNSKSKNKQITDLITKLSEVIKSVNDATMLVPLVKEYLEIGVKNDEQLVKLAGIIQRLLHPVSKKTEEEIENALLPESERQQLLEDVKTLKETGTDVTIERLTRKTENVIEKINGNKEK